MTRRDFFKTLAAWFGLITLPVLPGLAAAQPRRLIQRSLLAEFQLHEGEELWSYLTVGDSLELRREPGSPHDGNAVRVDWLGRKLGYLPKNQSHAAARLLEQGRTLEGRIAGLRKDANPWHRMAVEVWLIG